MTKKYQVFISSTYQDLSEERDQVIKAILEMGHIPVGMEMFSAADEEQWKIIARQIDEIDYYVVIAAHRYGSVTKEGVSYTEKEFDYAVAKGVPVLGFVIDSGASWPNDRCDSDARQKKKLEAFKKKIKARLIHFWSTKEELHGKLSISLMKAITANPRIGWIRATEGTGAEVTKELTRLSSENSLLREKLQALQKQSESRPDEVRVAIRILNGNLRRFKVRGADNSDWEKAKIYEKTLADIFHWTAVNLISENTSLGFSQDIALQVVGVDYYNSYPVASNFVAEYIADFAALNLVEPSKKKHPVSDKKAYWSLTKLGKQVHSEFRRVQLEEGLAVVEAASESDAVSEGS